MKSTASCRIVWKIALAMAAGLASAHCSSNDDAERQGGAEPSATDAVDLASSFTLLVSTSASRSAPVALDGASLSAIAYVFTSDASKSSMPPGITQVRYWLDDTPMTGAPTHVENYAPYDFVGTGSGGIALGLDTTKLANGTHTITESVTRTSGAIESTTASFRVGTTTCTPTTCAAQGKNCGSISDGCGGTLACGSCTSPATCGGAGQPNLCGAPNMNHYYVATNGSDGNDGSMAHPWATINHADKTLTLGQHGTVVHVLPGTYSAGNSTRHAGTATQPVRFLSESHWGAKMTGFWAVQGPYQEIVGFEFTAPGMGGIIACYTGVNNNTTGHHCSILGNYVHDIGTSMCASAGAINTAVVAGNGEPTTDAARGYNRVIGNVIRHVGADAGAPNHCNQFHGVYLSGPHDVAANNIISGTIGWGIHARGDATAQVIANNTVFNNSHGGIILDETGPIYSVYDYATVVNNVVVNNGLAGAAPAFGISEYNMTLGTHNLLSNNLLYGNLPSNWSRGETSTYGAISCADPCKDPHMQTGSDATVFASYKSDWNTAPAAAYNAANYALKSGSNAIDHGTTTCTAGGTSPCAPVIDFVGGSRPAGGALDIGAFELGATDPAWPWY